MFVILVNTFLPGCHARQHAGFHAAQFNRRESSHTKIHTNTVVHRCPRFHVKREWMTMKSHVIPQPTAHTVLLRRRRTSSLATAACLLVLSSITTCNSFTVPNEPSKCPINHHRSDTTIQRRPIVVPPPLHLFRELLSDDEEDLRADIAVIKEQDGLDDFLKQDDRLCVIK